MGKRMFSFCIAAALFLGAPSILLFAQDPAENKEARFTPTYVETIFRVSPKKFVVDDVITVGGVVAFDQVFTIHWEDLSAQRLKLKPFKVINVVIGPQQPHAQGKNFFADYRPVEIQLALEDAGKRGVLKIPAITIGYSWQDGEKTIKKSVTLGPWSVQRVPIKVSGSLSAGVLHLGERAEMQLLVTREKDIKVLNQFLGILKDESIPEVNKSETRRWLKSLEARKESAFNLSSPDLRPMKVLGKSIQEAARASSVISAYTYTVAYYEEAKKIVTLPPVKIWYMPKGGEFKEYQEPALLALEPFQVVVASRMAGKDRRLDGPEPPRVRDFGVVEKYGFGYGFIIAGPIAVLVGLALILRRPDRAAVKRQIYSKPISFRKASRELIFPAGVDINFGPQRARQFRSQVWMVVGAVLGLTAEEVRSKSSDELIETITSRYHREQIEPVIKLIEFCDESLTLSDIGAQESASRIAELLTEARPYLKRKSPWNAACQNRQSDVFLPL